MERLLIVVVLFAAGVVLLFYLVDKLSRKWLGVETGPSFVSRPVNETHRKIDWTLRAVFVFILLILAVVLSSDNFSTEHWFYVFSGYLLISNVILEAIRAYMQKKYSEQKKEYLVTVIQILLLIVIFAVLVRTRFFGVW